MQCVFDIVVSIKMTFFLSFLQIFLFYIFMSILLIACCGNLTPEVVDYAKNYSILKTEFKPNIIALFIGLVSKLKSMYDNRSGLPFSGVTF